MGHSTSYLESPRAPRYESLDVWRGVACLMVVAYHVGGLDRPLETIPLVRWLLGQMWLGVPMFFVISGYCIAATCDSARRRDHAFRWYLWRRARRIFPPYWICLILSGLAATLHFVGTDIVAPSDLPLESWVGNLTLTERWRPRVFGGDQLFVLNTAWTLCYEEQFYFVCGLVLSVVPGFFFAGIVIVTLAALPLSVLNWSGAVVLQGFFFDGYWFQFAAGVLVYYSRNYAAGWTRVGHVALLIGAMLMTVLLRAKLPTALVGGHSRMAFLDGTTFALAFSVGLLVLEKWDIRIARSLVMKPLQACGIMCYSLYLTHLPVLSGARVLSDAWTGSGPAGSGRTSTSKLEALVIVTCCLIVGWVFFRVVENRFLNTRPRPHAGTPHAGPLG